MFIVKLILSLLLPPVAVYLQVGATLHLWINIALLILTAGIGAVIHSLFVVISDVKA